jgi:hypothetical protein
MSRKRFVRDPIRAHQREVTAARRVGEGSKCACGEQRPLALIAGRSPITCAECDRKKRGKVTIDRHHIAGKANSPITVAVPVNDHRALLSEAQYDWPQSTLQNPDNNTNRMLAARVRGYIDIHEYLFDKLLREVAEILESEAHSSSPAKRRK